MHMSYPFAQNKNKTAIERFVAKLKNGDNYTLCAIRRAMELWNSEN